MDTNELLELLLAAHVHTRARDLRLAAVCTAGGDSAAQDTFRASHPVTEYVPRALAELLDTAALIRTATAAL